MVSSGGMWREGSIKIGEDIFHYWIKQYDDGSVYGIEGGRIASQKGAFAAAYQHHYADRSGRAAGHSGR